MSIVDYGQFHPAIDTTYFPGCRSSYYWSGSPYAHYANYAWLVYFYHGVVTYSNKASDYYVRCVRGGP